MDNQRYAKIADKQLVLLSRFNTWKNHFSSGRLFTKSKKENDDKRKTETQPGLACVSSTWAGAWLAAVPDNEQY
jgi:hypothetical protein